jgi:hypothetical protein
MYYKEQRFQIDPSIITRQIADEVILVPVRANGQDMNSIYTLNVTAARAWDLFQNGKTLGEVQSQLVIEFCVEMEQAWNDLVELVENLEKIGALSEIKNDLH